MRTATILLCCCALLACEKERAPAGGNTGATTADGFDRSCARCHGSENSPAPPLDLLGQTDPLARGVGAHASHVSAAHNLASPVACSSCHVVPEAVESPGHMDAPWPAKVTFGGLAVAKGAKPALSADQGTGDPRADSPIKVSCASVYCHGSTLSGGAASAPVWNTPDAKWTRCDACHGFPPPQTSRGTPHPTSTACAHCHDETAAADGTIRNPAKHIDGVVEVRAGTCNACHGSADNDAPPVDASGRSETTLPSVGAHQSHLKTAMASKALCTDCHSAVKDVYDPGHIGAGAGKVNFANGRAVARGSQPVWDPAAASCATVYCHGPKQRDGSSSGGTGAALKWTQVDGTQATCGKCHGLPPPLPHPQKSTCSACHAETMAEDNATIAHPEKHVDGIVQVKGGGAACNSCHGDASAVNPAPGDSSTAPPVDTNGKSDTALVTVGAHASHVKAAHGLAAPVRCVQCHTVPSAVDSPGHNTGQEAAVTFGALAKADDATPAWNGQAATCTAYCHGQTLGGGSLTTPKWTKVDGTQAACGTCHGLPPPAPHPADAACSKCHDTVGPDNVTIEKPDQHVNGVVSTIGGVTCHACHGSAANNAPPMDVKRKSDTSLVSVGAHQTHVATTRSRPVACSECHPMPTKFQHYDGVVQLEFGPLSKSGNHNPSFSEASATCASTYCHGPTQPNGAATGGSINTPVWTKVDGTQNACGTCHGLPPPSPHPQMPSCSKCHDTVGPDNKTIVKPAQHVDGLVQVANMTCNSCHGSATNNAPPMDTKGNTAATFVGVGAHQAHLTGGRWSRVIACTECHAVPTALRHADGKVDFAWGPIATTKGMTPAFDAGTATCSSTWCHAVQGFGKTTPCSTGLATNCTPKWNPASNPADQAACGKCHATVPSTGMHAINTSHIDCSFCHPGYTFDFGTHLPGISDKSAHVNGRMEVGGPTTRVVSYEYATGSCTLKNPAAHNNEIRKWSGW